jgi:hypothetical protein
MNDLLEACQMFCVNGVGFRSSAIISNGAEADQPVF